MRTTDALAFVRVSTGSQDEKTQVRDLTAYADDTRHGVRLVSWTKLHGYSAGAGEQDQDLREAIEGIQQGRWQAIMVTDSSRLERRDDATRFIKMLLSIYEAGGIIISLDEDEKEFGQHESFDAWTDALNRAKYNAEKSKTVKKMTWRGVKEIIANKASYGPLPVFWEAKGKRFHKVATCNNPDAVKAVYEAVRDGQSLSSLARKYDTYPQSIRRLVRTEANKTGVFECRYTYQGQPYTWQHTAAGTPPVDKALWQEANDVMGERGAVLNNTGGRKIQLAKSWISGILPCPQCGGILYPLRGKTLRCSGRGKDRRSCGVHGIDLAYVIDQIEEIISDEHTKVYRYQRTSGNAAELAELKAELERVRATLAITDDDDEFERLSVRRKTLRDEIANFKLVADTYDMTPTGDTLADLWRAGDTDAKQKIMKALQRYVGFNVGWSNDPEQAKAVNGYVWIEGFYPGGKLIELTHDICIKMELPTRPDFDVTA